MHQLRKKSNLGSNQNIISLKGLKSLDKASEYKIIKNQNISSRTDEGNSESILSRIKKKTFSLSRLQSVQQSQYAQGLIQNNKKEMQKGECLEEKVRFEKLSIMRKGGLQNKQVGKNYRRLNERNQFFINQNSGQEELSLLKQILKRKQDDLIMGREEKKQKPETSEKQLQNCQLNGLITNENNLMKNNESISNYSKNRQNQNNSIKRIKLLKRTKEYEFYDSLVHNLLHKINDSKNSQELNTPPPLKIPNSNQDQNFNNLFNNNLKELQIHFSSLHKNQNLPQSNYKNVRHNSLQNIHSNSNQKFIKTFTSNFTTVSSSVANTNNPNSNSKQHILINKKKQSMIFRLSDLTSDNIYQKKISSFIQFLYKVNFSNSIYVDLSLSNFYNKRSIKVFVGRGNNCQLIKSIINRRFWLELTTNKNQSNIIWTQDTQKDIHKIQVSSMEKKTQIKQNDQQLQKSKRPTYSLKNKFTTSSYNQNRNLKILNSRQVQQATAAFSRSYLGLKSLYPQVRFQLITNHIPNNSIIGSKKILFKLMHWYYSQMEKIDPFTFLPHTYHIIPGDKDNEGIKKFKEEQLHKKQRIWIVKPGQNTNRGNGISVASTNEIEMLMRYKKLHKNGDLKTFIVQKYLKPFLYNNRKFDIRHYMLVTSVNGFIKGYWYNAGYIRTSSQKFDLDQLDNEFIHLTNDAIQKNSQNYGKYEEGNKLSYTSFQRYLDNTVPHKKYDFEKQILDQMKKITTDVLRAGFMFLDPERNERLIKGKGCNFQLYGMDFMIDHKFKPYLIQINANPCLQISCPLLQRLIPIAIEHTFRLALDPLVPPNDHYVPSKRYLLSDRVLDRLKYELIFDEKNEGKQLRKRYKNCEQKFELNGVALEPEQDLFEDDGKEIKDDKLFDEGRQ